MRLKSLLMLVLVIACGSLCAEGQAADRTPSAPGASVAFGNLADGDVVPPAFVIRFAISGMGVAPAGSRIENTGHFHLLIDLAETPDFDLPLPANCRCSQIAVNDSNSNVAIWLSGTSVVCCWLFITASPFTGRPPPNECEAGPVRRSTMKFDPSGQHLASGSFDRKICKDCT